MFVHITTLLKNSEFDSDRRKNVEKIENSSTEKGQGQYVMSYECLRAESGLYTVLI